MARIAVLVSAAFLAGVALGFLMGARRGSGPPATAPAPAEGSLAAHQRPAEQPAARNDRTQTEPAPSAAGPSESGDGSITGTVMTDSGEALAGVVVRAQLTERRNRGDTAHRREAATDAAGQFAITGLARGHYDVSAHREGYRIEAKGGGGAWVSVEPAALVDFVALALSGVRVSVLLPDGHLAGEAQIECETGTKYNPHRAQESWSREDPVLWLRPGVWKVRAVLGDSLASDANELSIPEGAVDLEIALRLKPRLSIKGKVIFPDEDWMEEVIVSLLKGGGKVAPNFQTDWNNGKKTWIGGEDRRSFFLTDLTPATYTLGAVGTHQNVLVVDTVELVDASVTKDLTLPAPDPADFVLVRVFGPQGQALTDVELTMGRRNKRGHEARTVTAVKRRDGALLVKQHDHPSPGDAEEWKHWIEVKSAAYGARKLEYVPGETRELRVDFAEPATLEVTIANHAGSGYEDSLQLLLRRVHAGESEYGVQKALPNGRAVLGPLEPGNYRVLLSFSGFGMSLEILADTLSLDAGANQVSLTLPPLHPLTVILDDPIGAEQVHLRPTATPRRTSLAPGKKPGRDGRVVFEKVPSGQYRVFVTGGIARLDMEVTVPAPGDVRFNPPPLNCFEVTVSSEGGYLTTCGLQTGDVVVGIDGTAFENPTQMEVLMIAATLKKEAKLRVLRGDQELEISADPRKLRNEELMGGHLWPASR